MHLTVVIKGPCVTLQMLGSLFNRLLAQQQLKTYQPKLPRQVNYTDLQRNTFLFLRSSHPEAMGLVHKLTMLGKPYAYYIDDDFWNIPLAASSYAHFAKAETRHIIDHFMTHASLVLTQSVYLAQLLEQRFNRPVTVMPSFFDFESLPFDILPPVNLDIPLKIGFSGTVREAEFEQLLIPAYQRLKSRYSDKIVFHYLGATENIVTRFNHLFNQQGLFTTLTGSNTDYAQFLHIKHHAQWDVGVSPLFDNTFSRCKSDLKFRDYAALGIPAVFSDVHPYRDVVADQQTGLLVQNTPDAWVNALSQLIDQPTQRTLIRQQAFQQVKQQFSVEQASQRWLAVLEQLDKQSMVSKALLMQVMLGDACKTLVSLPQKLGKEAGRILNKRLKPD
jgi:glycosyltransferase involved in cell wall biosynthesis